MAKKKPGRFSPSARLEEVRSLLEDPDGVSVHDIADRVGVSIRTAHRYLRELQDRGVSLIEDIDGQRKVWRVMPAARRSAVQLNVAQMVALSFSKGMFEPLEGTGLKEYMEQVFHQLNAHLRQRDVDGVTNIDRKLYAFNDAPYAYDGRTEDVDEIITALLKENRLELRHASVSNGRKVFRLDPYSLLLYKSGLYLVGHSHHHEAVLTFALDRIREVTWLRKESFEYPKNFDPTEHVGRFGLIKRKSDRVRIFFDREVEKLIRPRKWHPTQTITKVNGGIELTMEVELSVELEAWVANYVEYAEVLEPPELRDRMAERISKACARYQPG